MAGTHPSAVQTSSRRFSSGIARLPPVSLRSVSPCQRQATARTGTKARTLQERAGEPGKLLSSRGHHQTHRDHAGGGLWARGHSSHVRSAAGVRSAGQSTDHTRQNRRRHRRPRLSSDASCLRRRRCEDGTRWDRRRRADRRPASSGRGRDLRLPVPPISTGRGHVHAPPQSAGRIRPTPRTWCSTSARSPSACCRR